MNTAASEHEEGETHKSLTVGLLYVRVPSHDAVDQTNHHNFPSMEPSTAITRTIRCAIWLATFATFVNLGYGQTKSRPTPASEIQIVEMSGAAELQRPGSTFAANTNQVLQAGDRLRAHKNTRITLRWTDQTIVRQREGTEIQIQAPPGPQAVPGLRLLSGIL